MAEVTVLGAGSWGTAIAILLAKNKHKVHLWTIDKEQAKSLKESKENKQFLPGITLPENIIIETDIKKAVENSSSISVVVPSQAVREVVTKAAPFIKDDALVISMAKGFENKTMLRISEVLTELLPGRDIAVLSGPSHAEEVAKGLPAAVVAAAEDITVAETVQELFMSPFFRVYTSADILGVEIAASLKNVIALGTGISDGLGWGDNAKAALLSRGLVEISRLGEAMGANVNTFAGLAGLGDLVTTCNSQFGRNRRAGILLAEGVPLDRILTEMGMVVEGVTATENADILAKEYNIEMPIVDQLYKVLFDNRDVKEAMQELMGRDRKSENKDTVE